MSKLMLALTAGTALATAAPLAAQVNAQANVNSTAWIENRMEQLEDRLETGIDAGTIDRAEARSLRAQMRQINRAERQYLADGSLSQSERRDLIQRIRAVRQDMRVADGGNSRYAEWREDDPYGGYDPYGSSGYGSGPGYAQVDEVCASSNNVASVFGRIFGSDRCLRVGERVTTTLSAVPSQYRGQFPPRTGYRYGYLDGNVIEVQTSTGVVTRIYDLG